MCGILAYYSNNNTTLEEFKNKLKKLQHRGQDSCGLSYIQNSKHNVVNEKTFDALSEKIQNQNAKNIIGHTRYTTSGSKNTPIHQPFFSTNKFGDYCLAFNGNIPIEKYLDNHKYNSDTIMIIDFLNSMSYEHDNWNELLQFFMSYFEKSYSLLIQTKDSLYIVKDSYGVRPLFYVENKHTNTYIFSSESYLFNTFDVPKEVKGGEIYGLNKYGMKKLYEYNRYYQTHCLFEYIYFLNNSSKFDSVNVKEYRENIGRELALQDLETKDFSNSNCLVVGVPNTGNDYAVTYSETINIPYKNYITKNRKVNRTFILKDNDERNKFANLKYIFDENLKKKDIIIIDDSLVRGITLKNLIKNLKEFGVNKIHIRIAAPPIINPCEYGIDIPTQEELIYNTYDSTEKLKEYLGSDSLKYISIKKVLSVLPNYDKKCTLCFNNDPNLEW